MDYQGVAPFEEFSTEDNQLLMSVLSSTPVSEQYNIAYPQSASSSFQMWDSQPAYATGQGSYNAFNSPSLPHGFAHPHPANRSPILPHQQLPPQMHPSLGSFQSHLVHQPQQGPYQAQPSHNPFAVRHEPHSHVPIKQENNMPVFTPNTTPYAASQPQGMTGQFGQAPLALSQGINPSPHTTRTLIIPLCNISTPRAHPWCTPKLESVTPRERGENRIRSAV